MQNGEHNHLQTNVEDNSDTELPTEYNTRYGRKVIRTQRWIERNEKDRASSCHTADIRLQLEDQNQEDT